MINPLLLQNMKNITLKIILKGDLLQSQSCGKLVSQGKKYYP